VEGIDVQHAVFAHPTLLITVSSLSTINAWRLTVKGQGGRKGDVSLHREATLRGTTGKITCLTASKGWSMVVAGCGVSCAPKCTANSADRAGWICDRVGYESTKIYPYNSITPQRIYQVCQCT
jgi:hypothetical protein